MPRRSPFRVGSESRKKHLPDGLLQVLEKGTFAVVVEVESEIVDLYLPRPRRLLSHHLLGGVEGEGLPFDDRLRGRLLRDHRLRTRREKARLEALLDIG